MTEWVPIIVAVVTTFIASSGFWSYLATRRNNNSATTRLLMGLAYDRLTYIGLKFVEQGDISKDEYEEFRKYLYDPYKELGGNGTVDRIMVAVSALPIHHNRHSIYSHVEGEKDDNPHFH